MNKVLLIAIVATICASNSFAQSMKKLSFTSSYQIDKTFNGNKKVDNRIVSISLVDPKSITNPNSDFDHLPIGKLVIQYQHIQQPLVYSIKYYGIYGGNKADHWYGITDSPTDYNAFILYRNENPSAKTKNYKYIVLTGNMNADTGNFITYTAYYCNLN